MEAALWRAGFRAVAGVDEVGRGALAGPLVAGAVILGPGGLTAGLTGLRDSKQLTPAQRSALVPAITSGALAWGLGLAAATEVDSSGVAYATRLAMRRALAACAIEPDFALVDGTDRQPFPCPHRSIIGGDGRVTSIAAASVLAKVFRDDWMLSLDEEFSMYGFASNKGYGTPVHLGALGRCGPCPQHRYSFAPVRAAGGGGPTRQVAASRVR